ncbi:unnamed protein product [Callosobruchus maculatus]|uniref:Uncharacterized protein n=1 Tax=Callosobruchus maculatus TaxID=64391 RepID=A0A653DNV6_CALMS|nr:unnamed protein product [Callosobruchus maculatus]
MINAGIASFTYACVGTHLFEKPNYNKSSLFSLY